MTNKGNLLGGERVEEPLIKIKRVRWPIYGICGFIFFVFFLVSFIAYKVLGYGKLVAIGFLIVVIILTIILYYAHYERITLYRDYFVHRRLGFTKTVHFSKINKIVKMTNSQFSNFQYQYSSISFVFLQDNNQIYAIDALLFNKKTKNLFFTFIEKNHPHIFIEK
jgi:hypothetical protein